MIKSIRGNFKIYDLKIVEIEKKNHFMDFQTPLLSCIAMFSPIWANGKTSHRGQSHLIQLKTYLCFIHHVQEIRKL
jgi:hypothetical protein